MAVTRKVTKKQLKENPSQEYLIAGGIALFTLFLYFHSLQNGFVDWDDPGYLRDNPFIQHLGWEQVKSIFSSFYSGNYHPVTTVTFALEYAVSGYRSATLYHFNNLWLHLVNVLLVYWFIRLISQNRLVAAVVAILFGIHPMHVESVAWISERKDVLYGAFFLASLVCYCYYLRETGSHLNAGKTASGSRKKFYFLSLMFFLAAVLSKSAAVVFPVILLLIDFLLNRKFSTGQIVEKIPFFLIALVFGILALYSQESAIQRGVELELTPLNRFLAVNFSLVRYIGFLFYPAGLSAYHPYPVMFSETPGIIGFIPVVLVGIVAAVAIYSLKYSRKWVFGLIFFFVNIVLVLQILPVGGAFMAERYTYISYIGLFYIPGLVIQNLTENKLTKSALRYMFFGLLIFGLFLLSITTYKRVGVWNNSLTLFSDVVNKYPENYQAYNLRASARSETDANGAIADFTRSIELNPANPRAYNNRGNLYSAGRRYREALADYNEALKSDSTLTEALNNRGAIKAIFGDFNGALDDLNKSLRLKPGSKDAFRNSGLVRMQLKDLHSAREDWKIAAGLGDETSGKLLSKYPE